MFLSGKVRQQQFLIVVFFDIRLNPLDPSFSEVWDLHFLRIQQAAGDCLQQRIKEKIDHCGAFQRKACFLSEIAQGGIDQKFRQCAMVLFTDGLFCERSLAEFHSGNLRKVGFKEGQRHLKLHISECQRGLQAKNFVALAGINEPQIPPFSIGAFVR